MDYRTQILLLTTTFCAATGRSEARIATIVHSQGTFFNRLRRGQGCTVDTYLKVKRWFEQNWPQGVDWPEGVDPPEMLPRWSDNPPVVSDRLAEDAA